MEARHPGRGLLNRLQRSLETTQMHMVIPSVHMCELGMKDDLRPAAGTPWLPAIWQLIKVDSLLLYYCTAAVGIFLKEEEEEEERKKDTSQEITY